MPIKRIPCDSQEERTPQLTYRRFKSNYKITRLYNVHCIFVSVMVITEIRINF